MAATILILGLGPTKFTPLGLIGYVAATSTIGAVYGAVSHTMKCEKADDVFTRRMTQRMFSEALWGPITVPAAIVVTPIRFIASGF